ncbi:MAG TPA: DUF6607 family protein [Methylomirabilota bacterium]|nr:DUF6607 family protein [Methylomirabilota bacterium]
MPARPLLLALLLVGAALPAAAADDAQLDRGLQAVQRMAGCFLVDYSYVEVQALRPGYERDPRVYDVNRDKSAKEWIVAEPISPRRIRLQRVLFLTDPSGAVRPGTEVRHQSEDWEFDAPFLYEFVAPSRWEPRDLRATPGLWTRRVTNLDDGPRYQCAARWSGDTAYPEWSCGGNYAPIPGRETRDMGRKDYQALDRSTRIIIYGASQPGSWLERQENVKTIHTAAGREPLVRELGKNWYVRLPDAECAAGQAFAAPRRAFWTLLRETWDGILDGSKRFVERTPAGQPPRFVRMFELEDQATGRDLSSEQVREATRREILDIIQQYRADQSPPARSPRPPAGRDPAGSCSSAR